MKILTQLLVDALFEKSQKSRSDCPVIRKKKGEEELILFFFRTYSQILTTLLYFIILISTLLGVHYGENSILSIPLDSFQSSYFMISLKII